MDLSKTFSTVFFALHLTRLDPDGQQFLVQVILRVLGLEWCTQAHAERVAVATRRHGFQALPDAGEYVMKI